MNVKPAPGQLWIILLLLALPWQSRAQSSGAVTIEKEDTLYSRILGEKRPLFINLPASYENDEFYVNKHYPVLILLDADTHFGYAAGMIRFLSSGENEQIQVLVGHSLAGLFATNCLLNQSPLAAYIAIDPTLGWNDSYLVKKADSLFNAKPATTTRLHLSQSNNPFEPGRHMGGGAKPSTHSMRFWRTPEKSHTALHSTNKTRTLQYLSRVCTTDSYSFSKATHSLTKRSLNREARA